MRPSTLFERILGWLGNLPVRLAYRIIWLFAALGGRTAFAVHEAMWNARLAVPPITDAQREQRRREMDPNDPMTPWGETE